MNTIYLIWGVEITDAERCQTVTRPGCAHEVFPEHKHCPDCGAPREIKAKIDRYRDGPIQAYGLRGNVILGAEIYATDVLDNYSIAAHLEDEAFVRARKVWDEFAPKALPKEIWTRTPRLYLVVE